MKYEMTQEAKAAYDEAVAAVPILDAAGHDVAAKLVQTIAVSIAIIDRLTFQRNAYHGYAAAMVSTAFHFGAEEAVAMIDKEAFEEPQDAEPELSACRAAVAAFHAPKETVPE